MHAKRKRSQQKDKLSQDKEYSEKGDAYRCPVKFLITTTVQQTREREEKAYKTVLKC